LLESHFTQKHHANTRPTPKAVTLAAKTLRVRDKESQITAMIQPFVKPNWSSWTSDNIEASKLVGYQRFWNCRTFNAFYQISIRKTQKPNCAAWTI